ncbi:aminoglycoside phosphotransferase [Marinithermus hydrothermalis DSM 14884]|uniref:Aminoglycoside phosphotransferase n=2 Tax=Marinithermus TaxID=186191 RepID=F2NQV0_MARHT|nr:aminoglycoside phosphotransferase [Marinithermus hydrothermalis DSM 14884]
MLEARFGFPLTLVGDGLEARVLRGGPYVFKVYAPPERALVRREARNMARAGLSERVVEVLDDATLDGYGALIMQAFEGQPLTAARFNDRVLAYLSGFLQRLHTLPEAGRTSSTELAARLDAFAQALRDLPEATELIQQLKGHLAQVGGVTHRFSHRDLWAGNILVREGGEILIVDWARAGGEDPARDLAILKTGTLDLLGEAAATHTLRRIVRQYPEPQALWARLRFYVPLTYLHDLYWFRTKHPEGFAEAVRDKLPRARRFYEAFTPL